jgi:hypothetical protein
MSNPGASEDVEEHDGEPIADDTDLLFGRPRGSSGAIEATAPRPR